MIRSNFIFFLSFLFCFCVSQNICAEILPADVPLFSKMIEAHTYKLARPISTWHYDDNDRLKELGVSVDSTEQALSSIQYLSGRFWNNEIISQDSPGYYVASDPWGSRAWGKKDFRLTIVKLKKNIRVLNEKELRLDVISKLKYDAIVNEISSVGCGFIIYPTMIRTSINPDCRLLVINLFKSLGIQAVSYSFQDAKIIGSCIRKETNTALILLDPQAVEVETLEVFSKDSAVTENLMFTKLLYDEAFRDEANPFHYPEYQKPLWDIQVLNGPSYEERKQTEVWGCGELSPLE